MIVYRSLSSQVCSKGYFQECFHCNQELSRINCIKELSRVLIFPESIKDIIYTVFQICSKILSSCFNGVSWVFPGGFRKISRVFQRYFNFISGLFQECISISRLCLVSLKFTWCFKDVYSLISKVFQVLDISMMA